MKANLCTECVYFDTQIRYDEVPCDKGHKPKFFKPKGFSDMRCGWKRKCSDFLKKEKAK